MTNSLAVPLAQAQERVAALREQHQRAHGDANQADPSAQTVADLQAQIEAAKADAYLNGQRADVSKMEAQIAAAGKKSAEANATREAAQAALPVLARRIAQAEAEVEKLTLEHYSASLDAEVASYLDGLKEYNAAARALIAALGKTMARAQVVSMLSARLERRSLELDFVANILVHPLQLPIEVRPETWLHIGAWDAVSEQARPMRIQRVEELAANGVDVDGPALVKKAAAEPSAPTEPRPVQVIVDGKAEDTGPRLVVAGLVDSVAH